jgi:lipopolysaccharide/colanic/teichoic acid biosynthesis glycosyltransferase
MRRYARLVMYAGVFVVVLGLAKVHATYVGHYDLTGTRRLAWSAAYAGLLCLTAYGVGLPDLPRTRWAVVTASVSAAVMGAAAMSIVQLVAGDALLPRFVVFGTAVLIPDWFRLCSRLSAGGRLRAEARDRVVVVGSLDEARTLELELHGDPERPAVVALELAVDDRDRAGSLSIAEASRRAGATVLVLDAEAVGRSDVIAEAAVLHAEGVRIRTLAGFYEEWLGKLPVAELERSSLLFDVGELHRSRYGRVKRLLDVVAGVVGLVVLALLLPVVLLANRIGNRGPLLYRQERVGKGGRPFTILKLRTMRPIAAGAETSGEWTAEHDPRVTRFGGILRRTHLDELPQVVNILRGDLAVVGPRPEQPRYVADLREKLPFYDVRHVVRPGLTGWAQVKYGYAGNEADALEKLQYEFWYLRHQSLATDLRILGRTVRSVVGSRGQGR